MIATTSPTVARSRLSDGQTSTGRGLRPADPAQRRRADDLHGGDGHYWFVDVHLADGRVGTTSWAATVGVLGVESPGDFVLSDEDLDLTFAAPPE